MNAVLPHTISPFTGEPGPVALCGGGAQPRFPRVSRHQIELNNTLVSRALNGRLTAGQQTLEWRIEAEGNRPALEFRATVRIKHQFFRLSFDSQLLSWMVESLQEHTCFAPETGGSACYGALPEPVLLALCQAAIIPLNRWLSAHCGFSIDIVDFHRFPAATGTELAENAAPLFTLVTRQGEKLSIATLTTDNTQNPHNPYDKTFLTVQTLLDKIARQQQKNPAAPLTRLAAPLRDIPLSLPVTLAAPAISLAELRELKAGDLLVAPIEISGLDRAYRLLLGEKTAYDLEYRDGQFTVLEQAEITPLSDSPRLRRNRPMENTETAPPYTDREEQNIPTPEEADTDSAFDDIPVRLYFEVGSLDIALRELEALKPGYIFSLNRTLEQPVTLHANGRVIGHCEFVQVGDQLAARVVKLG